MKYLLIIAFAGIFSCKTSSKGNTEEKTNDDNAVSETLEAVTDISDEQCYLFVAVKDTYALRLNIIGEKIAGRAIFKNYEKDSSHGTVEGEIKNDIVHLWYNFQSEGMHSVRELYFKKESDRLITGIADEQVKGDSAYVPDPATIKYEGSVYTKTNCDFVPVFQ